jgi:paraquat-inducible protein B
VTPDPKLEDVPRARITRSPRRWTFAWLVTIVAVALAGVLGYQAWRTRGRVVSIRFEDASGIRAGDPVAYRGLQIGEIRRVRLADDLGGIVVEASLRPDAEAVAVEGSRWWIVRPEIGLRRIEGLETLLGPRYLEVEPGPEGSPARTEFDGLDRAPDEVVEAPGSLRLRLAATRRGSLSVGSPVLYRDIRVGAVRHLALAEDGTSVEVGIVIEPEHAHLVRDNSRFWNSGGIGFDWGIFAGLSVRTESLETFLGGGIGFATPNRPGDLVGDGAEFELAEEPNPDWLKWSPELTTADAD